MKTTLVAFAPLLIAGTLRPMRRCRCSRDRGSPFRSAHKDPRKSGERNGAIGKAITARGEKSSGKIRWREERRAPERCDRI